MAEDKTKDIITQMRDTYWQWCKDFYGEPPQHSSQNSFAIEFNMLKGIKNMLVGSYKSHNPGSVPTDETLLEMWQHILGYLREKNNYNAAKLYYIHHNYNTITAQLRRHNQKLKEQEIKAKKQQMASAEAMQRAKIIQQMMGGE